MRRYIFLFYLLIGVIACHSQQRFSENTALEFNYFTGYTLPEYQFINYLVEERTQSVELTLLKNTTGKTIWEQVYGYPFYGISLLYSSLGNNEVLGKEVAVTPFVRIPIIQQNKIQFYTQIGLGASFVTKKFSLENNFQNVAVGSHFNFHFNSRLGLQWNLRENLSFLTGLSLDHFSNANTAEPNLGINYLSGFIGLQYYLQPKSSKIEHEIPDHLPFYENEIVLSFGGKHARSLSSKYYFTSSLSFEKRKAVRRALHLGVGADLFYDTSIKDQLSKDNKTYKSYYDIQTGIHFSQNIVYNRFSLTLQEGIYLFLPERIEQYMMYNRGIFKYFVTKQLSIRLTMKSHLHILDYPEIGLGIKL